MLLRVESVLSIDGGNVLRTILTSDRILVAI